MSSREGLYLGAAAAAFALAIGAVVYSARGTVQLPEFALTDSEGHAFHRSDMEGRVWIADFIFTSCASACPRLTSAMLLLQRDLPEEVALLSISVDPARDTPEVLRDYARDAGARWKFVTGPQRELERAVVEGFHAPLGTQAFDIVHGDKFVLIDRRGGIRGYYDSGDRERLLADARALR